MLLHFFSEVNKALPCRVSNGRKSAQGSGICVLRVFYNMKKRYPLISASFESLFGLWGEAIFVLALQTFFLCMKEGAVFL